MIREALTGKRILLTGSTGFLGMALLERLLDLPVDRLDVAIRGDAAKRLSWTLASSAFGPLRQRLGSAAFDELVAEKLNPLSVDLSVEAPPVADDIDLILHSAATVSFDPPIDEAFETNLAGTLRLYEAGGGRPFIHVSTAYVAGVTRGTQPERFLDRQVDWRAESDFAARTRVETEQESRSPELLDRLGATARTEMGKAGPQSVATRTEELRETWVKDRLIRAGQARARSLGWPDAYGFTKALTEQALNETAGDNPLTIVRPSIIESSLERPFPGWIEGFRMADPIMLGIGRAALPDFPGIPEGVLDIIPVDMVVNCILAVAASPPQRRAIYHSCSGDRNPLRYRESYRLTAEYFVDDPLPERARGTYKVPEWSFPGRRAVDKKLRAAQRVVETAERLVGRLPRNHFARETAHKVDRLRRRFDFVKKYADLYGPYVEAEVIYTDPNAKALYESLPPEDQRDFGFDPTTYTWDHYFKEVHLPMLTAPLRWPQPTRAEPAVSIPNGNGSHPGDKPPIVAVFDVEGTVVSSNVPETFLWLRLADVEDPVERARRMSHTLRRVPRYLKAERRDRGEFLRMFYRHYEGVSAAAVRELAEQSMSTLLLQRLAPAAVRRIREHRRAGHRIIFITGSLDFIVEPLTALTDGIVSARLREVDGRFTGDLETPPLVGEARASWLRDYADANGIDLEQSYGYADSMSDLPLLEAVGIPVAVNPDVALHRLARARKWPVEEWDPEKGVSRVLIPSPAPDLRVRT